MMSLLPLLFSAWWADLDRPHRLMDQNFGLGLYPEQLRVMDKYYPTSLVDRAALDLYYRPWADLLRLDNRGTSTITADKDNFKVILDVHQFKPEEISVKVVDRYIVVEAKHEEKRDEHGLISRQFVRRYLLPEQTDADKVTSNISTDGILTIIAPLKEPIEKPNERTIKIEFTGKPAVTTTPKEGEKKPEEGTPEEKTPKEEEVTITTEESTPLK
ncbi:hypothetical protein KPH14_010905 [Odynerus spinipes]|uniref:SHSP domain-containing protein n=1 Tax=Odynerus spinipes TaxID=1348599 RepID=A0AAD9RH25_9HYME|nr:hypothetical protein KPH14_010905 [Odynerus spinipes]